jgi:KipI family sensor histidine kinase inhibitor
LSFSNPTERWVEIPMCYGGKFGPDLAAVAAHTGLSEAEVIRRHSAGSYRVFLLGFVPGFAYLGGLDPQLATPRRETPRARVEPGSVGIAGTQTGVYPLAAPGGWQIIGRTPLSLFRPQETPPTLLHPGDRVRFRVVEPQEFAF